MKHGWKVFAVLLFVVVTSVNWTPNAEELQWLQATPVNGHGTQLTAVLDAPIPKDQNLLWCATMQMAWDAAGKELGQPMLLMPPSKLADTLNQHAFDPRWLDRKASLIRGGRVADGVLQEFDAGARALSGRRSKVLKHLTPGLAKGDLVFLAMIHKELGFVKPFGRLGKWPLGGHEVPCFGFMPGQKESADLQQQVKVHHYQTKDDFVIELLSKDREEQLVLARVPGPHGTLEKVSAGVLARLRAKSPSATRNDLLMVPNIVADEVARFSELEGRRVKNKPDLILRQAIQSIEFNMDETGVKLHSEAAISFGCSVPPRFDPRVMILKPPFVLMLKRRDAPQPYFVAWFANVDLLRAK